MARAASVDTQRADRYAFADGIRGLAALWVVLFHVSAGKHIETARDWMPALIERVVFAYGHLGVAVFFVLSGFVMALNAVERRASGSFAGRFVARRLVRLTPPYYLAILISLLYMAVDRVLLQQPVQMPGPTSLLAHAVYAQDLLGFSQINGVLWTICIEIQFYLAFVLLLLLADLGSPDRPAAFTRCMLLAIGGLASLVWPLHWINGAPWPGSFVPYWYSFCAGALVCWGWLRGGAALKLALGYCALLGVASLASGDAFAITAALSAAMLLAVALAGKMPVWLNERWAQFLGQISYSFYLVHNNIIGACFFAMRKVLPAGLAGEIIGAVISVGAAIVGAWLLYRLIELPSIRWSRRIAPYGDRTPARAPGTAAPHG